MLAVWDTLATLAPNVRGLEGEAATSKRRPANHSAWLSGRRGEFDRRFRDAAAHDLDFPEAEGTKVRPRRM
jgi:hypothetical protein